MAAEGGGGGADGVGRGGGGNETPSISPKSRVKLLCSYGGKILLRPTDGVLKYVGGETRVVAFSRGINFSELMQKLSGLFEGDLVLKYQLAPEDLDALVTVKTDEDLAHMLDEYERQEGEGTTPRLRAFLFPSAPIVLDPHIPSTDAAAIEQHYIDAINGVVRTFPALKIIPPKPSFTVSSDCSSPKSLSPDPTTSHDSFIPRALLHKVQSSPSLYSLNHHQQQLADTHLNSTGSIPLAYHQPHPHPHAHPHQHHYSQNSYQQHHHPGFPPARPPQDPSKGAAGERSPSGLSKCRAIASPYYTSARQKQQQQQQQQHKGFGSSNRYVQLEEGVGHRGQRLLDRAETPPPM